MPSAIPELRLLLGELDGVHAQDAHNVGVQTTLIVCRGPFQGPMYRQIDGHFDGHCGACLGSGLGVTHGV